MRNGCTRRDGKTSGKNKNYKSSRTEVYVMSVAEYPRTVIAKCSDGTIITVAIAVPLILTLNSVLTTSGRAADRFIKKIISH